MLAKSFRFHGHNSVRTAYRHGRQVRGGFGSLHVLGGERVTSVKVAVVVSKKVNKSAVARNRIRRRVYELVRVQMPHFRNPVQLVFTIYQTDVGTMPHEELQKQVADLLKSARVL